MKRFIFTVILLPIVASVYAQDFVDNALLFSRTQVAGSARMQGFGGAHVSLGGDYSSAISNPAGLGMFNRSEFTFSLGTYNNQTSAAFLGNASDDSKSVLTIPGISYVQKQNYTKDKFLGGAFGISYSRTNSFNTQYQYAGDNAESSRIEYFKDRALEYNPNEMLYQGFDFYNLTALAYNNFLFEDIYDDVTNEFLGYNSALDTIPGEIRTVRQTEAVLRKGSQSQVSLSYGGNYDDRLFFGGSLGITSIRFEQTQNYTESNYRFSEDASYNPLDQFTTDENFDIQGSGINLTLGLIYRPVDFLQIGVSYATPTLYNITDSYIAGMRASWNNFDYFGDGTTFLNSTSEEFDVPLISEYDFSTPAKLNAGLTLISKYGFISGEVEFINYAKARYSSTIAGISFSPENNDINAFYRKTVNYKIGGEFRYKVFRARAGYNFMADPYRDVSVSNAPSINGSVQSISAGIGVRNSKFFIDFATVRAETEERRNPYVYTNSPTAILGVVNTSYLVTVGFPF